MANLPPAKPKGMKTRDFLGQLMNVSGKTIDHAKTVLESGDAELIAAVETGRLPVSKAAKIVKDRQRGTTTATPDRWQVALKKCEAARKTCDELLSSFPDEGQHSVVQRLHDRIVEYLEEHRQTYGSKQTTTDGATT